MAPLSAAKLTNDSRFLKVTRQSSGAPERLHATISNHMHSRQSKLQQETVYRVMRLLHDSQGINQRKLLRKLGINIDGLNNCLKALIQVGVGQGAELRPLQEQVQSNLLTHQRPSRKSRVNPKFPEKQARRIRRSQASDRRFAHRI